MPFLCDSVVLAARGAKAIAPHIICSWGGLLTWILLSVSWLQLPLLPNCSWPRWFRLQTGGEIRASHSQGRGPGGDAYPRHVWDSWSNPSPSRVDWESESQSGEEICPHMSSVPEWDSNLIPSSELILERVPKVPSSSHSPKCSCYNVYLLLK